VTESFASAFAGRGFSNGAAARAQDENREQGKQQERGGRKETARRKKTI
jgi:hypothetical protein